MRSPWLQLSCAMALAWLMAACASSDAKKSSTALNTPSGQPEVDIQSAGIDPILKVSREFFGRRGYTESPSRHAYEVVFDKPVEVRKRSRALRIRLRGRPSDGNSWRVWGLSLKVEDWGSDLASEAVVPHGFLQVQEFLEAIKLQVEANAQP